MYNDIGGRTGPTLLSLIWVRDGGIEVMTERLEDPAFRASVHSVHGRRWTGQAEGCRAAAKDQAW